MKALGIGTLFVFGTLTQELNGDTENCPIVDVTEEALIDYCIGMTVYLQR